MILLRTLKKALRLSDSFTAGKLPIDTVGKYVKIEAVKRKEQFNRDIC